MHALACVLAAYAARTGKFCIPIPSASDAADPNVAPGAEPIAPNVTPTAMPSGKLCIVIAMMSINNLRSFVTRPGTSLLLLLLTALDDGLLLLLLRGFAGLVLRFDLPFLSGSS